MKLNQNFKTHLLKYVDFDEKEVEQILSYFEYKSFNKRDMIVKAGQIEKYQHFIIEGTVRGYITDYKGKEHNIAFCFENYWFGDMESFIDASLACYNYQALDNLTVLSISKLNWDKLSNEVPNFLIYTGSLYRNAMIFQRKRVANHFMLSAEQRYNNLLEQHPYIIQRISLKNIALYLGVTPEFISRIRRESLSR